MVCGDWILSEYNTGGFVFGEFEDIVKTPNQIVISVLIKSKGKYLFIKPKSKSKSNILYLVGESVLNDINEKFVFGHGEKSVYLITKYMELTDEEAQAIRFHMSSWVENDKAMAGKVFATNKLAWLLHVADEMATYWDESWGVKW